MRERRVEAELVRAVKTMGGWCVKLLPSVAGLPDRLVLLPGGRVIFVELKSPTGRVQVHQEVVHHRLAGLGFDVVVLADLGSVAAWAAEVAEANEEPF